MITRKCNIEYRLNSIRRLLWEIHEGLYTKIKQTDDAAYSICKLVVEAQTNLELADPQIKEQSRLITKLENKVHQLERTMAIKERQKNGEPTRLADSIQK